MKSETFTPLLFIDIMRKPRESKCVNGGSWCDFWGKYDVVMLEKGVVEGEKGNRE